MALFSSKVDEYADPKVQIDQAIAEAQQQHAALSQQAAAVIGNQRQLEMRLNRQMGDVERLQASARQALVLADEARAKGDATKAAQYEQTAQTFATQLVDRRAGHGGHSRSCTTRRCRRPSRRSKAVEQNALRLQQTLAERTKLLSPAGAGQDAGAGRRFAEVDLRAQRAGQRAVAGRGAGQDRAPLRERARRAPSSPRTRSRAGCSRSSSRRSTWPASPGWTRSAPRCTRNSQVSRPGRSTPRRRTSRCRAAGAGAGAAAEHHRLSYLLPVVVPPPANGQHQSRPSARRSRSASPGWGRGRSSAQHPLCQTAARPRSGTRYSRGRETDRVPGADGGALPDPCGPGRWRWTTCSARWATGPRNQALAAGVPPRSVWFAVCDSFDVPATLRWGLPD